MKKQIILTMLSLSALNLAAQDIIVMKNGDEVEAKVTKVGTTEVEYHKWSNQDGPVYSVAKSDVFMVKYKNGEKDVFDNVSNSDDKEQTKEPNPLNPQYVQAITANNNQELISVYDVDVSLAVDKTGKLTNVILPVMRIAKESIISTDEIEMRITPTFTIENKNGGILWAKGHIWNTIELINKTNHNIYIDLANCFRTHSNGMAECYFNDEESTTITKGKSSGMGVGLGAVAGALNVGGVIGTLANGVSVGGGSQSSVSTTYNNIRIITIPPHSKKNLSEYKEVNVKGNEYKVISDIEHYNMYLGKEKFIKENELMMYDETNTPYYFLHRITYSSLPDFSKYSSLTAKVYVKYLIGLRHYYYHSNLDKHIKMISSKMIRDYSIDSNILLGDVSVQL